MEPDDVIETPAPPKPPTPDLPTRAKRLQAVDPQTAVRRLEGVAAAEVAQLLACMRPASANSLLAAMSTERRAAVIAAAPAGTDWTDAQRYAEGTVGRLLEDPAATFPSGTRVGVAIEALRQVVTQRLVTYLWVVDVQDRLLGVVAFRDLLYSGREQTLDEIMIRNPF